MRGLLAVPRLRHSPSAFAFAALAGKNDFGGLGATIIDSLDTLHMMGGWPV